MDKHIAQWLVDCGILPQFKEQEGSTVQLPDSFYRDIEYGQKLDSIIHYKSNLDKSDSSKQANWDTIESALKSLNFELSSSLRLGVTEGNRTEISRLIKILYLRFRPTGSNGLVPEKVDLKKSIKKCENCLEMIVISISKAFKTTPKQSLGLLAQNNRVLAHVIVKGYKKNFQPVLTWLKMLKTEINLLMNLAVGEDAIHVVLSIFRPGLLSKHEKVVKKAFKLIFRIVRFAIECGICLLYTSPSPRDS